MPAFGPSGGSSGGTGSSATSDPTVHIIREMLFIEAGSIVYINSPGIVLVTDGNLGKYLKVHAGSIAEFE
jgi:hypothetical protein